MKTPIVITTLEEDFKKIGLIKAAPIAESVEADEAELDEAEILEKKTRLTGGGTRSANTRQGHKEYIAAKRKDPAGFRKRAKKKAMAAKKGPAKQKAKKQAAKRERMNIKPIHSKFAKRGKGDMAGMPMGGKGDYGMSMEAFDAAEALKSFANAAIIAERLQTVFTEWVKSDLCESREDETEFLKLAGALATIAEEFAEIATALNESVDELDEEAVTEIFNEGLETVLDAVDLYEKNCGKGDEEDMEDEEDSEDEEEESDDEGND